MLVGRTERISGRSLCRAGKTPTLAGARSLSPTSATGSIVTGRRIGTPSRGPGNAFIGRTLTIIDGAVLEHAQRPSCVTRLRECRHAVEVSKNMCR